MQKIDTYALSIVQMSQKYRVAIIVPFPNLDTVPSLCSFIELLAEHGYYIDIFMRTSDDFEFPMFTDSQIQVFSSKSIEGRLGIHQFIHLWYLYPLKVMLRPFRPLLKKLLDEPLVPWMSIVQLRHTEIPYKVIIGADPQGLETAGRIADLLHVPLVYWSFELLISTELADRRWMSLKKREVALSRKATIIVIQDEERAKLMVLNNDVPISKFLFIPNAPIGPAQRRSTGYWHQYFGLKKDQRIVLHAGSLSYWTGIREIISLANEWPEGWVLIVHTRFHSDQNSYFKELHATADLRRVFFSTQPVARTVYPELVEGADIGIAFYLPTHTPFTQENIHTIGLSSGKIAYYLKAGLPIIVNMWPSISKLVQNERCGIAVGSASEISNAIRMISQHYEEYSDNARKVFERYLDPLACLQQFIMQIDKL